jgi:hypothetical protein
LPERLSAEEVIRRIDDWLQRLGDLFAQIKAWCDENGWSVTSGQPIQMNEEPMR